MVSDDAYESLKEFSEKISSSAEVSDSMLGQEAVESLSSGESSPEYKSQDVESLQSTPIDASEDSEMQEESSVCEEAASAVKDLEEFEDESQECGQDCASDEDY